VAADKWCQQCTVRPLHVCQPAAERITGPVWPLDAQRNPAPVGTGSRAPNPNPVLTARAGVPQDGVDFSVILSPVGGGAVQYLHEADYELSDKPTRQRLHFYLDKLETGDVIDFTVYPRGQHDCDGALLLEAQIWEQDAYKARALPRPTPAVCSQTHAHQPCALHRPLVWQAGLAARRLCSCTRPTSVPAGPPGSISNCLLGCLAADAWGL